MKPWFAMVEELECEKKTSSCAIYKKKKKKVLSWISADMVHIVGSHFLNDELISDLISLSQRHASFVLRLIWKPLLRGHADLGTVNQPVICTDTKMLLLNLLLGIDLLFLPGKCHSASRRFNNDQKRLWDTALLQEQSSRRLLKRSGREHWQQKAEMLGNHKKSGS